ncbi:hypothetical protein OIU79_019156 [Salix purpurea]|uniref:Uncharacterized protein n=1 Tax=Salix purpurea TaxID=77065 RepID=A0A9Q0SIT0_SALPP|nr:hypothetical protein OIU79_019156 [Salix purpurea]
MPVVAFGDEKRREENIPGTHMLVDKIMFVDILFKSVIYIENNRPRVGLHDYRAINWSEAIADGVEVNSINASGFTAKDALQTSGFPLNDCYLVIAVNENCRRSGLVLLVLAEFARFMIWLLKKWSVLPLKKDYLLLIGTGPWCEIEISFVSKFIDVPAH